MIVGMFLTVIPVVGMVMDGFIPLMNVRVSVAMLMDMGVYQIAMPVLVTVNMGMLMAAERDRIRGVLERLGLPTEPPVAMQKLVKEMVKDKKSEGGQLHLVIPRAIGRCESAPVEKGQLPQLFGVVE